VSSRLCCAIQSAVTRVSRKVLTGLAGAAAVTVSAALIWALYQGNRKTGGGLELYNTENKTTPEGLVRPGGLVILDDYSYPSVATAVRYFEANTGWQTEPMSAPTRLRAFRLPKERTEPSFESFKPFGLDTAP